MKSEKMAFVRPVSLKSFQKLAESILGFVTERRDTEKGVEGCKEDREFGGETGASTPV